MVRRGGQQGHDQLPLGADLVELPDAYVFLGEDAPETLARELVAFLPARA